MTLKKPLRKNKITPASDEQIFRLMFEGHSAVMLLIEPETGEILDANQAAADFYGYPESKLCGMMIYEINILPPPQVAMELQKALNGEQNYFVFPHKLANGEERIVEVHSSPITLQDKQLLFSIIHDITERKRIELTLVEESARRRIFFEQSPDGIVIVDPQTTRFLEFNTAAHQQLGYTREEFAQLGILDIEARETVDETHARIENVIQNGKAEFETLQRTRQGEVRTIHVSAQIINVEGHPVYYCVWRDLTEYKQAEEALKQSEAHYHLLANNMTDTVWLRDLNLNLLYVSPSEEKVRGYTLAELQQLPFEQLLTPASVQVAMELFTTEMPKILADPAYSPVHTREFEFYQRDGSLHSVESKMSIIRDENGNPVSILGQDRDITERKQAEIELHYMQESLKAANIELQAALVREKQLAHTDELTGINNRRHLFELAAHGFEVAMRYNPPLAVIMFDVDDFKHVNDTFGHAVGDQALEKITHIICTTLRSADLIGRYGGDEFVILMPQTSTQEALPLAERIHACVAAMRLETDKGLLSLTISIGITQTIHNNKQTDTVENLFLRADQALRSAKQDGKSRTVIFTQE